MTIILTLSRTRTEAAHVRQALGAPAREIQAEAGGRPTPPRPAIWLCDFACERAA